MGLFYSSLWTIPASFECIQQILVFQEQLTIDSGAIVTKEALSELLAAKALGDRVRSLRSEKCRGGDEPPCLGQVTLDKQTVLAFLVLLLPALSLQKFSNRERGNKTKRY